MTMPNKRWLTILAVLAGALALAGCLLTPGRFTSSLDIRKDGTFAFSYSGEIWMMPLSQLAAMDKPGDGEAFKAECHQALPPGTPEGVAKTRPCTAAEIAQQKRDWDDKRTERLATRKREAEGFKQMLGGLDPTDPAAGQQFAERLRKQAGWRKVVYKGDGLFDVDFAMTGRIDREFSFPTVERFPTVYAFLAVSPRQDGTVRIDAPGYTAASGANAANPFLGALAMAAAKDGTKVALPRPDGVFTLTTDAAILANNTEDGPAPTSAGVQVLRWVASPAVQSAPMAVLQLAPKGG